MECYGCENDKIYALVGKGKVHRFSFSKSLLGYLKETFAPGLDIERLSIRAGRELMDGEESRSGIYAILDRRKGKVLRVCMNLDYANELTRCDSRFIAECFVG